MKLVATKPEKNRPFLAHIGQSPGSHPIVGWLMPTLLTSSEIWNLRADRARVLLVKEMFLVQGIPVYERMGRTFLQFLFPPGRSELSRGSLKRTGGLRRCRALQT